MIHVSCITNLSHVIKEKKLCVSSFGVRCPYEKVERLLITGFRAEDPPEFTFDLFSCLHVVSVVGVLLTFVTISY